MHLIATLALFAAEVGGKAAEGTKAPNPILPAKNEIIWGFLSFIVLFVLLAKAESESNEVVERARQQIESERAAAVDAVRREAASFSVELAERIVRQTIDRDAQARLVEQYIAEIERMERATS